MFLTALQFFSRIPVPRWVGHHACMLDRAVRYFPLVGVLVGSLVWLVLWLAAAVFPVEIAVLLCMLASILLTGAFHEDGLCDYADGMGGGYTREQILRIMKDSSVGTYGVIALVMVLVLKFESLSLLTKAHSLSGMAAVLIAAYVLSRVTPVFIMQCLPYAREEETAKVRPVARQPGWSGLAIAVMTGLLAIGLLLHSGFPIFNIIIMLVFIGVIPVMLARQMKRNIGGYTGDGLGAVQQLSEMAIYLGLLYGN